MARTKKRMLWRDILATFKKSRGRFLSIACLIALGSFALVGLKVAGPDMRETSASYFASYDMADLAVIGGMGIDADDAADIEQASGIREVEYGYLKDVTITGTNDAMRVESTPDHVSQFEVVDGRMPAAEDEIAVDSFMAARYPVGSTIEFSEKEDASGSKTLKRETFTVVGHVSSMDIIANVNKGKTTVGTGDLSGYAVVSPDVFDVDYHMIARLTFDDTEGLDPYGAEYLSKVASHKEELSGLLSEAPERRLAVVRGEYDEQIDDGQKKVDDARQQLADARRQLASAQTLLASTRSQLDSGWGEYNDGMAQLADARKQMEAQVSETQGQIDAGRSQLNDGKAAYEQGIARLQAMLDNPNLPADMRIQLETQLSQTQTAYEQFMDADTGSVEGEQDGGYTALVAKLDAAQQQLDEQRAAGESQLAQRQAELDAAKEKLQAGEAEYASGLAQYQDKKASYDAGVAEYEDGRSSYESGLAVYNSATGTLAQKQSEYEDGLAEYNDALPDAEQQIADGEADLADARAERDKLEKPAYSVNTRRETPGAEGYKTYDSVSEIVDSLADIFPYFLYLVAALVASTTMTRMVDEERINSGTLKALGYRDRDVMKKFVVYGAAAGGLGSTVGVVLGHTLLPYIVYSAYAAKFSLPPIVLQWHLGISAAALALGLAVSVIPAVLVAKRSLAEKPAQLLLPKAPANGSKILLEHLTPIWSRLSFTQKVTCRNLLRYKKRMLMTVVGVAGAVCLMFCGFAVRNSIDGLSETQFGDIIGYDLIVAENNNVDANEQTQIDEELSSAAVTDYSSIRYESVTKIAGDKGDEQSINLLVPTDEETFTKYLDIRDRATGQAIPLSDDGTVISERLATLLGVQVGDDLTFKDSDGVERTTRVSGICEMYMEHFMFMSPAAYEKCFGKDMDANAYVVTLADDGTTGTRAEAAKFMSLDGVLGCVQSATLIDQINVVVKSLNKIMLVLIVVAILLAVVIVYNLVTINVAERIRELSTIKVLGFFDNEVSMYIYRETIINSLISLPVGWLFGWMLQQYIIAAVPPENVMFDPATGALPYIVSTVVVVGVVAVMYVVVNHRLKNVDMLEALKSVD